MQDEKTPFNQLKMSKPFTLGKEGLLLFKGVLPTWNAVVLHYVEKNDFKNLTLYGLYRAAVVINIIRACIRTSCVTCTYGTSGSKHLTSDYDINVSGESSDMVVTMFNTAFYNRFKQTSAEMFDTNVYGYPRLFDETNMKLNNEAFHTLIKDKQRYKYVKSPVLPKNQILNTHNQHIWALIKFLECVSESERKRCKGKAYFDEPFEYMMQEPKFDTIDANNMQYASFLTKVKETVKSIEGTDQDTVQDITEATDKLIIKYNQLVSHANYHGQETYFSTGPYMDVVVKHQMKINVDITKDQYMDSFIENIGYAISKLTHTDEDQCVPVVVNASKYLVRAWKAYNKINESHNDLLAPLETLYEFRGKPILPGPNVLLPFHRLVGDKQQCDIMTIRSFMFNKAIKILDEHFPDTHEHESVQHEHMQSFEHKGVWHDHMLSSMTFMRRQNVFVGRQSGLVNRQRGLEPPDYHWHANPVYL